jgi:hypothetical protein
MDCKEFRDLEQSFVELRRRRFELAANGTLTAEVEEQFARAELNALYALLDHRDQHGCQRKLGSAAALPASRNMGGIIGPY